MFMHNSHLKATVVLLLILIGFTVQPVFAHGFGQRYDLPVPLWLYITGAGTVVFFSFLVLGLFVKKPPGLQGYPRLNLFRWGVGRALINPFVVASVKIASVFVFGLVVVAGLLGNQEPIENVAPTMVWVIWWVGFAYLSSLVGNLWVAVNPWGAIFEWLDALYARINPGDRLSSNRPYPERLSYWPAVVLFSMFAWVELVYPGSSEPRVIAQMAILYSVVSVGGMIIYGKWAWLKYGEVFSVVFGLLARFAPTEVVVRNSTLCDLCDLNCDDGQGLCVDCYQCFGRAAMQQKALNLRPYGAGLLVSHIAPQSLLVLVILILATVTYDGFTATPLWADIVGVVLPLFQPFGGEVIAAIKTVGLFIFPLIFLTVFAGVSLIMASLVGRADKWLVFARAFVFSLIPISLAYHLAHFLSFLLIQAQLLIPLSSDPLGLGWNLFGSAEYKINIAIVNAKFAWIASVIVIAIGHVIAVYVAHLRAMQMFHERLIAIKSQFPMLALMIGYTMVSLWVIAQPIVERVE